ncbi:MAG: TetR/AcrR family transcriptional regulator, partial [Geodermatophilaceae bacterium]|nr:TetR/AcrR family transcriptional regulator [Geodermatophilaceae bacterium]
GEAALLIARAEDRNAALAAGEAALEILLDRLLGP